MFTTSSSVTKNLCGVHAVRFTQLMKELSATHLMEIQERDIVCPIVQQVLFGHMRTHRTNHE